MVTILGLNIGDIIEHAVEESLLFIPGQQSTKDRIIVEAGEHHQRILEAGSIDAAIRPLP